MAVAIIIICWVIVLRNMDAKRKLEDQAKAGIAPIGPADYATLKKTLAEISTRLASMEAQYQTLMQRGGGR